MQAVPSRDVVRRAGRAYREALAEGRPAAGVRLGGGYAGCWLPDRSVTPADLARAIERRLAGGGVRVLKRGSRVLVARVQVLGVDTVLKRYTLGGALERVRYRVRPSRARRAWAASRAMQRLDLPAAPSLGFLDVYRGGAPAVSYLLTRFLEGSCDASTWLRAHYRQQPPEVRALLSGELRAALAGLYARGVIHGDTKASNLLLRPPPDETGPRFTWIDLECVRFGVRPTRRAVVRNLVQLHGSLGSRIPLRDRLSFLDAFGRDVPRAAFPAAAQQVRRWTSRRLRREKVLGIGP